MGLTLKWPRVRTGAAEPSVPRAGTVPPGSDGCCAPAADGCCTKEVGSTAAPVFATSTPRCPQCGLPLDGPAIRCPRCNAALLVPGSCSGACRGCQSGCTLKV